MALHERNQETASRLERAEVKSLLKRKRIRLFPIWLRLVLIIILLTISIISGAAIGYGILGDGKASDIFKKSTWTHIIDLVEGK